MNPGAEGTGSRGRQTHRPLPADLLPCSFVASLGDSNNTKGQVVDFLGAFAIRSSASQELGMFVPHSNRVWLYRGARSDPIEVAVRQRSRVLTIPGCRLHRSAQQFDALLELPCVVQFDPRARGCRL